MLLVRPLFSWKPSLSSLESFDPSCEGVRKHQQVYIMSHGSWHNSSYQSSPGFVPWVCTPFTVGCGPAYGLFLAQIRQFYITF